jgi:hypothetical protein
VEAAYLKRRRFLWFCADGTRLERNLVRRAAVKAKDPASVDVTPV